MKGIKIELKEKSIPMPKDYGNKVEKYAEEYYAKQGFKVIREKYDLLSIAKKRTPDIERNNLEIENFFKSIGKEKELEILKEIRKLRGEFTISGQPDIFAYNENTKEYFFAEVKADKDKLRDEQKVIIALLKVALRLEENKHLILLRVTTKQNYNAADDKEKTENFIVTLNATDIK